MPGEDYPHCSDNSNKIAYRMKSAVTNNRNYYCWHVGNCTDTSCCILHPLGWSTHNYRAWLGTDCNLYINFATKWLDNWVSELVYLTSLLSSQGLMSDGRGPGNETKDERTPDMNTPGFYKPGVFVYHWCIVGNDLWYDRIYHQPSYCHCINCNNYCNKVCCMYGSSSYYL